MSILVLIQTGLGAFAPLREMHISHQRILICRQRFHAKAQSEQLYFCFDAAEVCSVCATKTIETLRFFAEWKGHGACTKRGDNFSSRT